MSFPRVVTSFAVLLAIAAAPLFPEPTQWLAALGAPLLIVALEVERRWPLGVQVAHTGAVAFFTATSVWQLLILAQKRVVEIHEWDFAGFWLHARSALRGANFYDPRSAQGLAATLDLSEEFHTEIVNVGFWYPPPSMFFFLPAGFPDIHRAVPFWLGLQLALLVGSSFVLWRVFFPATGPKHLAICLGLLAGCYGSLQTIDFGQTNFLLLLFFGLFLLAPERARAGVFVALGTLVKPFVACVGLLWLVRRRVEPILVALATAVVVTVCSIVAFGWTTFVHFFSGEKGKKPDWIYGEWTNQSALGFVHRRSGTTFTCEGIECVLPPAFVAVAVVLAAMTATFVWSTRMNEDRRDVAALVLCALMIYPVSQAFYSVMLVPVLLILYSNRARLPGGLFTLLALSAVDYFLFYGRAFVAYAITFGALMTTQWWPFSQGLRLRMAGAAGQRNGR